MDNKYDNVKLIIKKERLKVLMKGSIYTRHE